MVSNHIVANRAGVLLLRHHTVCIQTRFIKSLYRKRNSRYIFLLSNGYFYSQASKMFEEIYNIKVMESDKDVIQATISWNSNDIVCT